MQSTWLDSLVPSSPGRSARPRQRHSRAPLTIEPLEDRCLLATATHPTPVAILPNAQSETAVAINPIDQENLVAVSNDIGTEKTGVLSYASMDGGQTWTTVRMPSRIGNLSFTDLTDPSVAIGRNGIVYVAYEGIVSADDTRVVVAISTDGGQSYPFLSLVTPGPSSVDKPYVAVGPDHSHPATQDRVYVGWDSAATNQVLLANSPDGVAWSPPVVVSGSGDPTLYVTPAVGPNGEVYVLWTDNLPIPASQGIYVAASFDDGGSFTPRSQVASSAVSNDGYVIPAVPLDPPSGHPIADAPAIAVDHSGGPYNGRVYVTWTGVGAGGHNDTDVFLAASNDNGADWSALGGPVRVNDDGPGASQFFSTVAVDPAGGTVDLAWYDTRRDPTGRRADIFFTDSHDGGQTFEPNLQVTPRPSDQSLANPLRDLNHYGDYIGLAAAGGVAHPVWADNSANLGDLNVTTAQVQTARSVVAPSSPAPPLVIHRQIHRSRPRHQRRGKLRLVRSHRIAERIVDRRRME